jgi:hypothetical protein
MSECRFENIQCSRYYKSIICFYLSIGFGKLFFKLQLGDLGKFCHLWHDITLLLCWQGDKGKDAKRSISDGLDDASSRLKRS